jgi:uncharacterized protein (UPF0297 family)
MSNEDLIMKTMNKNMDAETFEELKQIYNRLKELGFNKIGGAYGAMDDPDEVKFFIMLDNYFRGIEQRKFIDGPFIREKGM